MKKRLSALLCALTLLWVMAVPAFADAMIDDFWYLGYDVDYEVYVVSADGKGLNIRSGPGTDHDVISETPIPDGTKIHISREIVNDYGNKWGYVWWDGGDVTASGWVYLPETSSHKPIVALDVDYFIYSNSADGLGLNLRSGPGSNYDKVGAPAIPNGTQVRVTKVSESDFGNSWGFVEYMGYQGWIYLPETTTEAPATPAPTPEVTPAPTPEATQAAAPETVEPTPEVQPTPTPAPAAATQAPAAAQAPDAGGVYTPLMLAMIAIAVLCVALAAILILVFLQKRK